MSVKQEKGHNTCYCIFTPKKYQIEIICYERKSEQPQISQAPDFLTMLHTMNDMYALITQNNLIIGHYFQKNHQNLLQICTYVFINYKGS